MNSRTVANRCKPWQTVGIPETVVGDHVVRGAVRQETELCGGWAVGGSSRHETEPRRFGAVRANRRGLWNRGQH